MLITQKTTIKWIILFAILLKLPFITTPVSDWHSWNQVSTMANARYIVQNGFDAFIQPEVDLFESFGKKSSQAFAELPILPGMIAIGFSITGSESEWIARLICILFSAFGSVYFYLLVRETSDETVAKIAIVFYLISPMVWFFHRTIMTDVVMVNFVTAGLYHYYFWIKSQKVSSFLYAAFFTAVAALSKAYALYIGIVYLFILIENHGWKKLIRTSNALFLFLTVTPIFTWIWYCSAQNSAGSNLTSTTGLLGPLSIWFNKVYWSTWLSSIGDFTLLSFGFLIFLYTFIRHFKKLKETKIALYWFVAVMFYFLLIREGNREHDYYQMPFAAPVIFITAFGLKEWFQWLYGKLTRNKFQFTFIIIWALLIIVAGKYTYVKASLDMSPVVLGKKINEFSQGNGYVLVVDPDPLQRNQAVYYSGSKGWHIRSLPSLIEIQDYKKHGVKYFGINYKVSSIGGKQDLLDKYQLKLNKIWEGNSTNRYQEEKILFIYEL